MQETPRQTPGPTVRLGATDQVKGAAIKIVAQVQADGLTMPEVLSALALATASIAYHAGAQRPGTDGELLETFWREVRRAHAAHVTQGIQTTQEFIIPSARMGFRG